VKIITNNSGNSFGLD